MGGGKGKRKERRGKEEGHDKFRLSRRASQKGPGKQFEAEGEF